MAIPEAKTEDEQALAAIFNKRDPDGVVDLMISLDQKRRRALNRFARSYHSARQKEVRLRDVFSSKATRCLLLAILATSTPSEVSKRADIVQLSWLGKRDASLLRLLETLRPDWIDAYVDRILRDELGSWHLVFDLYRQGLCRRPENDQFRLRMPNALAWIGSDKTTTGVDFAVSNSDLLVPEIYDLFALPQFEEISRHDFEPMVYDQWPEEDKYRARNGSWKLILSKMCEWDLIDRQRLIQAAFGAMAMVQKKPIVRWLAELIEGLTDESLVDWIEVGGELGLIPLLSSANPAAVSWALKKLSALTKENKVQPDLLLANIAPVLHQESKSTVNTAIKLLKRAVKKRPELHQQTCLTVIEALVHPEAVVHKEVLAVLETFSDRDDQELRLRLLDYSDTIAASVRTEFSKWLPDGGLPIELTAPIDTELRDLEPVLSPGRRIVPIDSVDELLEQVAHFLQNEQDMAELSRILDAFGRFADPPDDIKQRGGALVKQLDESYFGAFVHEFSQLPLHWINSPKSSWLGGVIKKIGQSLVAPKGALFRRLATPMRIALAARRKFELLSTPTHAGNWIDPVILVERVGRVEGTSREVWPVDAAMSLLRMSTENRDVARDAAGGLKTGLGCALRFALGDDVPIAEEDSHLWIAAARSREPGGSFDWISDRFNERGPDTAVPATYCLHHTPAQSKPSRWNKSQMIDEPASVRVGTEPDRGLAKEDLLPGALHDVFPRAGQDSSWWWSVDFNNTRWCATIWPANPDPILAQTVDYFSRGLNDTTQTFGEEFQTPLLAMLNEPAKPLGTLGYRVLALGLSLANRAGRAAAVDAVIANLEYRWFDTARFGMTISQFLSLDCLKLNRLIDSAKEVFAVGGLHRHRMTEIMTHSMALDCQEPPRMLNKWLELFLEQRLSDQPLSEESQSYLSSLPKKGALGKTLKKLL